MLVRRWLEIPYHRRASSDASRMSSDILEESRRKEERSSSSLVRKRRELPASQEKLYEDRFEERIYDRNMCSRSC